MAPGVRTIPTVHRALHQGGDDQHTGRRPPPAVRLHAQQRTECGPCDRRPSALTQVPHPAWVEEGRGQPWLMLSSVVDDRSGVAQQEYHGVQGEDGAAALRFLFATLAPKAVEGLPWSGRPPMVSLDGGPMARSQGVQPGMRQRGVDVRPLRTVQARPATLYHCPGPQTAAAAQIGRWQWVLRSNTMEHRRARQARLEAWLLTWPAAGLRAMGTWERCGTVARAPERRPVGGEARVSVDGGLEEVEPALAGETVLVWWGLVAQDLYGAPGARRQGPYAPVGGPIPLHRQRRFKQTSYEQRAERTEALADPLGLPRAAVDGPQPLSLPVAAAPPPRRPFAAPDPCHELTYPRALKAKPAIADALMMPRAQVPREQLVALDTLRAQTLRPSDVSDHGRRHLTPLLRGSS